MKARSESVTVRIARALGVLTLAVPGCLIVDPPGDLRSVASSGGNSVGGTSVASTGGDNELGGASGNSGTSGASASVAGGASGNLGTGGASGNLGTGGASAGGGGGLAGTSDSDLGGNAGASGGGAAGGAGFGGAGGSAAGGSGGASGNGGTGGSGGTGGFGGTGNCAGYALSLAANGTGTASDSAMARAQIDMGSDLPIGNTNRTVELWAYMKSSDWTANTNTLFFYGTNNRQADGFGLDFGNTTGSVGSIDPFTNAIFDNDNQPSGVTVTNPQWVHFAMTWDGTTVNAYVNGALKSSKNAGTSAQKTLMTGTSMLTVGGYPIESAYFAGLIDEFQVWNITRSASDISGSMGNTLTGNETGLVGYWQFNESSGVTAADGVKTPGHTPHAATLSAGASLVAPAPAAPVTCP